VLALLVDVKDPKEMFDVIYPRLDWGRIVREQTAERIVR